MEKKELSELFSSYNKIRASAPEEHILGRGKTPESVGKYDRPRANRALGVAQLKTPRPYHTTAWDCDCPDRIYRGVVCKHMLAERMKHSEK